MFVDIDHIKRANDELGHFFFSDGAMRFFNSRIHREVYAGRYFITSERYDAETPRLYTIRRANDDGSIDDVSEFQHYKTAREARHAIKIFLVHGGPRKAGGVWIPSNLYGKTNTH